MMSPEPPSKQQAFLAVLREGWTSLYLDARRPGVIVPAHLRGEAHLVLQYGHDLPIPIPDLEVDEYGVRATLSFQKLPHLTVVPWSAVYVVTCDDGRGVLYHEDVPDDVSIIAQSPQSQSDRLLAGPDLAEPRHATAPAPARGPLPRSLPADATAPSLPQAAMLSSQPVRRRRRPQLRLVK